MSAPRLLWSGLPDTVRVAVEARLGRPVAAARSHEGGYTGGLASTLILTGGARVFLKAVPDTHGLADVYRHEAAASAALPPGTPAPRILWADEAHGWLLHAYTAVPGRHPDLSPGSPDVALVLALVADLTERLTPCPWPDAPDLADDFAAILTCWRHLADGLDPRYIPDPDPDRWYRPRLAEFVAAEERAAAAAAGDTLVHQDIRTDNIPIPDRPGKQGHAAVLVDFAWAMRGARHTDAALLVPQLIRAGHTPAAAEALLARLPAWRSAHVGAITDLAVAMTGFWTLQARAPVGEELRAYRRSAAAAGRAWIDHRTR